MEVAIIVPVVGTISLAVLIIFIRKFINDERMAMIERGVDAKQFRHTNEFGSLRYGLLFVGAGLGLLLAGIFEAIFPALNDESLYFGLLFIFSGGGLFLSYQIEQKRRKERELEDK